MTKLVTEGHLLVLDYVDGPVPSPLTSPRDCLLFYPDSPVKELGPYAIRCGAYKAHVYSQGSSLSDTANPDRMCSDPRITHHSPPLLYHLDSDPGERWDLSSALPGLASSLLARLEEMAGMVSWAPSEMARGHSDLAAPCCNKVRVLLSYLLVSSYLTSSYLISHTSHRHISYLTLSYLIPHNIPLTFLKPNHTLLLAHLKFYPHTSHHILWSHTSSFQLPCKPWPSCCDCKFEENKDRTWRPGGK